MTSLKSVELHGPVPSAATQLQQLREERARVSYQIGELKKKGEPTEDLLRQSRLLSEQIKALERAEPSPAAVPEARALACSLACSIAEIENLQAEWGALGEGCPCTHLFATWEWVAAWYSAYARAGLIHCLQVRDGGRLIGLAPFFIPYRRDPNIGARQLGYAGTYGHAWGHYPEVLATPGQEELVMSALLDDLSREPRPWRAMKLLRVQPESHSIAAFLTETSRRGLRAYIKPGVASAMSDLPETPEQVLPHLPSRNLRNNVRGTWRDLQRDLPGARLRAVTDPQEVRQVLEALPDLNIRRRNSVGARSNFQDPPYLACYRRATASFAAAGWLRVHVLEAGDRLLGASADAIYRGQLYSLYPAFDPQFAAYGPSHLIMLRTMEDAVREGVRRMDLLTFYPHKSGYCREVRQLSDVIVFPDSVSGLWPVTVELMGRTLRSVARAVLKPGHKG